MALFDGAEVASAAVAPLCVDAADVDGVGVLDTGVDVGRLAGCAPAHADKINAALMAAAITR